ncbi:unnamed protein product [Arabidopsis halleri]
MSSSNSSISVARRTVGRTNRERGIPIKCHCGAPPIVRNSLGREYPGRRYYTCEMGEDGGAHIGKWWDEAMMEEATILMLEVEDGTDRMQRSKIEKIRRNIQTHREEMEHLNDLHGEHQTAVAMMKEVIAKKSDVKGVKQMQAEIAKKSDGIAVELRNMFLSSAKLDGN